MSEKKVLDPKMDFLKDPVGVIESAFETALPPDPKQVPFLDWGETQLFNHFLLDGGLSQVPLLNSKTVRWLQPNTLVRYRGMIQDMPGHELYARAYKVGDAWRTNKYTDVRKYASQGYPSDVYLWRRRLIYCIPVPGQNDWTEPSGSCMNLKTLRDEKHPRDEDAVTEDANELGVLAEGISSMTMVTSEVDIENLSCLVKIYSPDFHFELNEVFEFVGILSFDQAFGGILALDPPPGKVPRLHCLVQKKLSLSDFLPVPVSLEPNTHLVKPVREALLAHLTALLGNDDVAAQFMLLHLLASVRERKDTAAVDKLSLNLTSLTNERLSVFKNRILSILKHLLPFTHDLPPLTVELLNAGHLAPKKNDESKRLVSGGLQLPNESHLTIDVTQLKPGSLNSTGVCNATVLKSMLGCVEVDVDNNVDNNVINKFSDHKNGVPTDVQLLILSEGNSTSFPADLVLPFHPSSVDSPETPTADTLAAWRGYLATTRSLTHFIGYGMQKVVTDEMAAARRIDLSTALDFMRMLSMAPLMSFSFGETRLLMEHWQMVKELNRLRRERLQGSVKDPDLL